MNKTRNTMLSIVSALALAGAGFALYSCDGFAAAQAAGAEADAGRFGRNHAKYTIRGPKGWPNCVFYKSEVGELEKDYVLGTDRTVRVGHYGNGVNDHLRTELEAAGITVTGFYSASKDGEYCWVEFNLNEITEYKRL